MDQDPRLPFPAVSAHIGVISVPPFFVFFEFEKQMLFSDAYLESAAL